MAFLDFLGCSIEDGHPITKQDGGIDKALMSDLPKEKQDQVINWIKTNIEPSDTVLEERTSYGIKHILQRKLGIYTTNNQFKDAMLMCGFKPADINTLNWEFFISKDSKCFSA